MNDNEIIFRSYDNLHKITVNIHLNEYCWFNIDIFDNNNCKTFLILIKEVVDFINEKNIKNIKQYIYSDDVKYFKNSFIEKHIDYNTNTNINNNDIYIVQSKIENFIDELVTVLEIKRI